MKLLKELLRIVLRLFSSKVKQNHVFDMIVKMMNYTEQKLPTGLREALSGNTVSAVPLESC